MLETFDKNMDKKVTLEVKNATAHLHTSLYDDDNTHKLDGPQIIKEVKNLMDRKIDKNDFEELIRSKSSKRDMEMMLNSVSVLHQQIFSTVQLMNKQLRMDLEQDAAETKNQRYKKQTNLLFSLSLVQNWIQKFNPKQINDCFDGAEKAMPQEIKNLMLDIQDDVKMKEKLPNPRHLKQLTDKLRQTSTNLTGYATMPGSKRTSPLRVKTRFHEKKQSVSSQQQPIKIQNDDPNNNWKNKKQSLAHKTEYSKTYDQTQDKTGANTGENTSSTTKVLRRRDLKNIYRSLDVDLSKTNDATISRLMKTPMGSNQNFTDTYSDMLMKQIYPRRKDVIGTPEHQPVEFPHRGIQQQLPFRLSTQVGPRHHRIIQKDEKRDQNVQIDLIIKDTAVPRSKKHVVLT